MTARVILLVRHLMKKTYSFCVCLCSSSQPSGFRPRPHSLQQSYRLLTLLAQRYDILRFAPALIFLTVAICSRVIFVLSFTPACARGSMPRRARDSDPAASGAAHEGPGLDDAEADTIANRVVRWRREKPPRNYVRLQHTIAKAQEQLLGKKQKIS